MKAIGVMFIVGLVVIIIIGLVINIMVLNAIKKHICEDCKYKELCESHENDSDFTPPCYKDIDPISKMTV